MLIHKPHCSQVFIHIKIADTYIIHSQVRSKTNKYSRKSQVSENQYASYKYSLPLEQTFIQLSNTRVTGTTMHIAAKKTKGTHNLI